MNIIQARELFPAFCSTVYLDTASRGLLSRPVREAMEWYLADWEMRGGSKDRWMEELSSTRERFARLIGASAEEISFTKNVSEGLNIIANAMAWCEGDNVVICADVEHPNNIYVWLNLERRGVRVKMVSSRLGRISAEDYLTAIDERTRLVWFESPINPTLRCVDIGAVADACRARGVVSAIDNTFASPINQRPLALGIDLSMQSATKYLNGHSDVTGGVLSGRRELIQPLAMARRKLGGVMDPQAGYALGRGLKTLPLRVARHNANALAVAMALEGHPGVKHVYYPGLPSHPDHAIAKRQMTGFGGVVCIDLEGGQRAAYRAFDRLQVVKRAASLGGAESLCSLPILTSQWATRTSSWRQPASRKG